MGGKRKHFIMVKSNNIWIFVFIFLVFLSCNKTNKVNDKEIEKVKIIKDFGFVLNDFLVEYDTVQKGATLSTILEKHPLGDYNVYQIVEKVRDYFNLKNIKTGNPIVYLKSLNAPHVLKAFVYQSNSIDYTVIDLRDSVVVKNRKKPITIKRRVIASEIKGSLFETLNTEGVDASVAQNLANVYAYTVDFFRIQKGDKFGIAFNEKFINDTIYAGIESIESSFFEYKGNMIYAFPYKLDANASKYDYYDEEGKPLKTMFLKAPLDFFRISSRYSPKRFHPVQKTWKAHQGTDYAAPKGTPIRATASGTVERTGFTAGNGNYVKIKHNSTYSTQYLHMSKIIARQGKHVSQGEVIGLVGSTGLATGPHVCYRFWKNGKQVDPLVEVLPKAPPMSNKVRPQYLAHIAPLKKELDSIATLKFK
jgi:murein DD-endopeptidase MepM/ murein hydrolase activator NlpD